MTILHLIIAWVGVFVVYLIWSRIRINLRLGLPFWDFRPYNFLFGAFSFALVVFIAILIVRPQPELTDADAKIKFGETTRQPWVTVIGLREKIRTDEKNIDLHFRLMQNHFAQRDPDLAPPDKAWYIDEESDIYTYYTDLSQSTDSTLHDIGHIMLAYYHTEQRPPDYHESFTHLNFVDDPTRKYVNYLKGKVLLQTGGGMQAEDYLFSEIKHKGYKHGAYELLGFLYRSTNNDSALASIVYSGADNFIRDDIRARVYYQHRDAWNFFRMKLQSMFSGINPWAISGGIAILAIWLFFLWSLTFISRIHLLKLLLPVFLGAVLAMSSWWLYTFYKHGLGFWLNGEILNDAIFSFAGIGLIEELVKLVPFVFILWFTNIIRKPIDYIVVASACGLGFAVFENLMYISSYGLDVIHSRALTSSLSHMVCSGIVAYGFVLRRYRWNTRWWLIPLFFLLAAAAHGFYDFWLLNDKVRSLGILTLFFFLSEILIYISFINNALNQTVEIGAETPTGKFDSSRLTSVLAGSFILLFTFEYLAICIVYGTRYGNDAITTAFLSGGYLVFFISIRLAQIKIEPGRWNRIDFITGILPSQLFDRGKPE